MADIFKAYDIRGVYPEELNEELVFKIGQAAAIYLKAKNLVVGRDARLSSPSLSQKLVDGIRSVGCDVLYISQCTTPIFYFAVTKLGSDGGVMVTASHNPADNNGLKIVGKGTLPISLYDGLADIKKIADGEIKESDQKGIIIDSKVIPGYIDFLVEKSNWFSESNMKCMGNCSLKIVIDAGNGMTPLVLAPLIDKLALNYVPLFFDIDGTFPNHSPDVSRSENLGALRDKVVAEKANIGFAFDGDGDRIAVVGENGEQIRADYITALLFKYGEGIVKDPKVAYDFRFSKSVVEFLGNKGVPMRVGHSIIKANMRALNLDLGGEFSGHYFFKETNYSESSVLVMLKVLKILAEQLKPITELIKPFQKYYHSGEINLEIKHDFGQKEQRIQTLKEKYKDGKISELDGIKIDYWDKNPIGQKWWFNVRASNTQPLLRLVVEADTEELMKERVKELTRLIEQFTG